MVGKVPRLRELFRLRTPAEERRTGSSRTPGLIQRQSIDVHGSKATLLARASGQATSLI